MSILITIGHILRSCGGKNNCLLILSNICAENGLFLTAVTTADNDVRFVHLRSTEQDTRHFLNGVLIDGGGRVVAYPPKRLQPLPMADVAAVIEAQTHEVIEAVNGSVATLYWDDGTQQWSICSSRSVNINQLSLMGGVEFKHAFEQLMERKGLSWESFDRAYSYTFVMCHPAYHIMPMYDLYFIVCWSQERKQMCDLPEHLSALRQIRCDYGVAEIESRCASSGERLGLGERAGIFGYVLRTTRVGRPDYYVESDVMHFLRKTVYEAYGENHTVAYEWRKMHMLIQMLIAEQENRTMFGRVFGEAFATELQNLRELFATLRGLLAAYVAGGCGPLPELHPAVFYAFASEAVKLNIAPAAIVCRELRKQLFDYAVHYAE